MNIYTPYVYFITFTNPSTPEKLYYIGSEYSEISKVAHPSNLFTIYDTSSVRVKELIEEFGKECFKISIRKTFKTGNEATDYETKLLTKIDAKRRPDFINESNGTRGSYGQMSERAKTKMVETRSITYLERFGTEHPMKNPEINLKSVLKHIKRVSINGTEYPSCLEAAKALNVTKGAISQWVKKQRNQAYFV
jgi:hypothetical protein